MRIARNVVLVAGAFGAWLTWLVVALPESWIVVATGVVILLLWLLFGLRLRNQKRHADMPARIAWVPLLCSVLAFVGYGQTLTQVHSHYYRQKFAAYLSKARRQQAQIEEEGKRFTREAIHLKAQMHREDRERAQALGRLRRESKAHIAGSTIREIKEVGDLIVAAHRSDVRLATLARHKHFKRGGIADLTVRSLTMPRPRFTGHCGEQSDHATAA